MTAEMSNPLCACGCGKEVRLPVNRFILGHSGRYANTNRFRTSDVISAIRMLEEGKSLKTIGSHFGMSATWIYVMTKKFRTEIEHKGNTLFPENKKRIIRASEWSQMIKRKEWNKAARIVSRLMQQLKKEQ